MRGILRWIAKEVREALPAIAYFLIAFSIIVITDALTTEEYGIKVFKLVSAVVGAVIVGKVVLIANSLPFMNPFQNRPLIYDALWKTMIYVLLSLLVHYTEHLISFISRYHSFVVANHHLIDEVNWPRFWAIEIWLSVLFFVFSCLQELDGALGKGRLRQMFIGR